MTNVGNMSTCPAYWPQAVCAAAEFASLLQFLPTCVLQGA